jgi:mono/diheme cytochrome c family protein
MDNARRFSSSVAARWSHRLALPFPGLVLVSLLATNPTRAQPYGDAAEGGRLTTMWCIGCHQIGPLESNLASDAVPSFRAVANMPSTTSLSLHAFLRTPHQAMPDLMLTEEQMDDIASYIIGLRAPALK